jgi:DNA-binding PadR family transcriptional regulator
VSLRHALLGALAYAPRTGYALTKHFRGSLAYAWPASHSQIYPELARLQQAGLIEQTGTGARGAKTYAATPAGLDEVRRWLRETSPDRGGRNDPLLRAFFVWLLETDEAAAFFEREADYQRGLLEELRAIEAQPDPVDAKQHAYRIALEHGLRVTEAKLEWAEWARAAVRRDEVL